MDYVDILFQDEQMYDFNGGDILSNLQEPVFAGQDSDNVPFFPFPLSVDLIDDSNSSSHSLMLNDETESTLSTVSPTVFSNENNMIVPMELSTDQNFDQHLQVNHMKMRNVRTKRPRILLTPEQFDEKRQKHNETEIKRRKVLSESLDHLKKMVGLGKAKISQSELLQATVDKLKDYQQKITELEVSYFLFGSHCNTSYLSLA